MTAQQYAKRLAIGTKTGKFDSVSRKFCALNVEDTKNLISELVEILKENKIKDKQADEVSVITLQSLRDILSDPELEEVLQ